MVDALQSEDICRIMLPDTLGVLSPRETRRFVKAMVEHYPHLRFDYHAHNDYDLAVANVLAAVEEGCSGVHCTVNGLGERAGNASLASVVAVINDMTEARVRVEEKSINSVSRMVESYSGMALAANQPIVGENVFTQTAGVHADGDKKAGLYVNRLLPERFGRSREYALGKMSGKANIEQNLRLLGISLSEEDMKKVTRRINELGGGERQTIRGVGHGRRSVRRLRARRAPYLPRRPRTHFPLALQLPGDHPPRRSYRRAGADGHLVAVRRQDLPHQRPGRRSDGSGHQGDHQNVELIRRIKRYETQDCSVGR